MGSLFSSPAVGDGECGVSLVPGHSIPAKLLISLPMSKEEKASLDQGPKGATMEELHAECICWITHGVLKHYNANNPGAKFQYPAESSTEMKAACTGFREDFLLYHLSFSARRRDSEEMHLFFAELCYDLDSQKMKLETCIILEKPCRSSCAFCPEESKIMHPSETEFVCGKEGQQTEFFRFRQMLLLPFDDSVGDLEL